MNPNTVNPPRLALSEDKINRTVFLTRMFWIFSLFTGFTICFVIPPIHLEKGLSYMLLAIGFLIAGLSFFVSYSFERYLSQQRVTRDALPFAEEFRRGFIISRILCYVLVESALLILLMAIEPQDDTIRNYMLVGFGTLIAIYFPTRQSLEQSYTRIVQSESINL